MATPLNTIKNWFKTGLYPTQTQFWATWDSFWHKDEPIPQNNVQDLETDLLSKQDKAGLHAIATSGDYNDLSNRPTKIVMIDKWLVWKLAPVPDHSVIQDGDKIQGQFDANRFGTYEVLDASDLTDYENLNMINEYDASS